MEGKLTVSFIGRERGSELANGRSGGQELQERKNGVFKDKITGK